MKSKIVLTLCVMVFSVPAMVSALEVPASFWNLPLLVRPGVDDLKATVGDVFQHKTFKAYTRADGAKISAGYGKFEYQGNTLKLPVIILRDGKAEATFTFYIDNVGMTAYLAKVIVVNNKTNERMTLETFQEKMQGMMLYEQLLKR